MVLDGGAPNLKSSIVVAPIISGDTHTAEKDSMTLRRSKLPMPYLLFLLCWRWCQILILVVSLIAAAGNDGTTMRPHRRRLNRWNLPNIVGGASIIEAIDNTTTKTTTYLDTHETTLLSTGNTSVKDLNNTLYVVKRDGQREPLNATKMLERLQSLSDGLDLRYINLEELTYQILQGVVPNVSSKELSVLAAETAASLATQHVDYSRLAARIVLTQNHQSTPALFSEAVHELYHDGRGFISQQLAQFVKDHRDEIDAAICHDRDFADHNTYFGYKTLERAYLLKSDITGQTVERPQYLWMRVALGIHCCGVGDAAAIQPDLKAALETYDLISRGYFTHASPTLFHAGTTHPQLSSCFLVQMSDDSIFGIYHTLATCALISKAAGGIGLSVHNIRARGTPIRGTRGVSNGLVPMLRVYDATSRYVDQGGGKRPGAFAIYLEPWHADIFDVLNLKKNHGKEEQRARDLFYGLWIPDLFLQRVQDNAHWSLMCPHVCKGLAQCHGAEFEQLYQDYEAQGMFVRQIPARDLWTAILEAQMETGTPYMLFKDAANTKCNQNNLGTIQCSNLCTEIIQYTAPDEVAVCNLASICLSKFVKTNRGSFGSAEDFSKGVSFDHEELHHVTKIVTRNLNKIIDVNSYPVTEAKTSNMCHRPIGIGVSGLADCFVRMGLPFCSAQAKQLNQAIFETMYHAALEASVELAERDGFYESFQGSPTSRGHLQFDLWGVTDDLVPSHRYFKEPEDDVVENNRATTDGLLSPQLYPPDCLTNKGYDWDGLRQRIMKNGLRNSLLLAPMPTASTSQILGVNECFEPFSSNLYIRRVKAGEFIMINPHLLQDLTDLGLWSPSVRNQLMQDGGSIANMESIPTRLKEIYKTAWEMKMKDIIDMSADRGVFIDQSQSLNLFIANPTIDKLTAMHFYAWKKGLKTGMYYLRTKPAVNAIQYTVENQAPTSDDNTLQPETSDDSFDDGIVCLSCQA